MALLQKGDVAPEFKGLNQNNKSNNQSFRLELI